MILKFGKQFRTEILALIGTIALFFGTRIYHLQARFWPMFVDEAIYAYWAQLGKFEPNMRLVSLSDGKPPLFVWLTTILMQWVGNPLMAGRIVSVIAGAATLAGLYFLTKELFKNNFTAILAALLYVVFPFALFQNRWALFESLVGAFFVWGIYFSVMLARYLRTESAFILGLVLGGGLLTKTTGLVNILLMPTAFLFLQESKKQGSYMNFLRWSFLSILAILLALLYFSVLNLSPQFSFISQKNDLFVYNIHEIFALKPLTTLFTNVSSFSQWLVILFTWPWVILLALTFFIQDRRREILFFWLWFVIPFFGLVILGQLVYPRYLSSISLPLLPLVALALTRIWQNFKRSWKTYAVFVLSFAFVVFSDYKILTDLPRAPLPEPSLFQHVNGWPAGGGVFEIINYLQKESLKGQIYVYTEGIYGSLPTTAMNIYFRDNANVHHDGITLTDKFPSEILKPLLAGYPVYLIINQAQKPPPWPLILVSEHRKGIGNWFIRLYRVKS